MMFSGSIEKKHEISTILFVEIGVSGPFPLDGIGIANITGPSSLIRNGDLNVNQ